MSSRRAFLSSLIACGVAAAADPERLLWEPGRKLISIPKPRLGVHLAGRIWYAGDLVPMGYGRYWQLEAVTPDAVRLREFVRPDHWPPSPLIPTRDISYTVWMDDAAIRAHSPGLVRAINSEHD